MNVNGIFSRGYRIVQTSEVGFELVKKVVSENDSDSYIKLIDFEIDEVQDRVSKLHDRLLSEIDYILSELMDNEMLKIEEELRLIGDILR